MISRIIGRWRSNKSDVEEVAAAEPPPPPPPAAAVEAPTSARDVLAAYLEETGGPVPEVPREEWSDLASKICDIAETSPPKAQSFPPLAYQLLDLLQDPDVDINNLVRLIHQDIAVTTALLSISNSVAYSPATPILTVRDAVQLIGTQQVGAIATAVATRSVFNQMTRTELAVYPDLLRVIQHDAMTDAFTSGWLGHALRVRAPDQAFVAGLLGDLGRLVALQIICHCVVSEGLEKPTELVAVAAIDDVAPLVGTRAVTSLGLPAELKAACQVYVQDAPIEACAGRLVTGIGAIARRSPHVNNYISRALDAAEKLNCPPRMLRNVIKQRIDDSAKAKFLVR